MYSWDMWADRGRETGSRLEVILETVKEGVPGTIVSSATTSSARRTSVSIWLRATRAAWVARKNSSFSRMIWDEEWNAAAMAVRSMVVIAREIITSLRLRPRRAGRG